jgi:hypothetical protein
MDVTKPYEVIGLGARRAPPGPLFSRFLRIMHVFAQALRKLNIALIIALVVALFSHHYRTIIALSRLTSGSPVGDPEGPSLPFPSLSFLSLLFFFLPVPSPPFPSLPFPALPFPSLPSRAVRSVCLGLVAPEVSLPRAPPKLWTPESEVCVLVWSPRKSPSQGPPQNCGHLPSLLLGNKMSTYQRLAVFPSKPRNCGRNRCGHPPGWCPHPWFGTGRPSEMACDVQVCSEPASGLKLGQPKPKLSGTVPTNRRTSIPNDSGPMSVCFDDDPKFSNCEIPVSTK